MTRLKRTLGISLIIGAFLVSGIVSYLVVSNLKEDVSDFSEQEAADPDVTDADTQGASEVELPSSIDDPIQGIADDFQDELIAQSETAIRNARLASLESWLAGENGAVTYAKIHEFLSDDPQVIDDLHTILLDPDAQNHWFHAATILVLLGGNEDSPRVVYDYVTRPIDTSSPNAVGILIGKARALSLLGRLNHTDEEIDRLLRLTITEDGAKSVVQGWGGDAAAELLKEQDWGVELIRGDAARGLVASGTEANLAVFNEAYEQEFELWKKTGQGTPVCLQLIDVMAESRWVQEHGRNSYLAGFGDSTAFWEILMPYVREVSQEWE